MPRAEPSVLVVDRDSAATRALVAFLRTNEFAVTWVRDGESALATLARESTDCLVCELRAPRIDGLAVLARARERHPQLSAVMIAAGADLAAAVEAMRRGAWDFQSKPLHLDKLLATLQLGLQHQALAERVVAMESQLDQRYGLEALTGRSRAIRRVQDQVRQIAPTRAPVLVEGEDGSGKSVVARAIHRASPRRDERFVWVSCGALGADEVEADLFGVDAAAPGGPRRGRFELADRGTLFLDEVEALPASAQARLLRALQERAAERIGGGDAVRADVRLVVATETDLAAAVAAKRFRDDLYRRIGIVRIVMPPLRERREDLPLLVEKFLRELGREHGRRVSGVTRGVMERLQAHAWPGNVRELKNTLESMVVVGKARRPLDVSALPAMLREPAAAHARPAVAVGMTLEEIEREVIQATLRRTDGQKPQAAAMLGIALRTLYRKLDRYRLR